MTDDKARELIERLRTQYVDAITAAEAAAFIEQTLAGGEPVAWRDEFRWLIEHPRTENNRWLPYLMARLGSDGFSNFAWTNNPDDALAFRTKEQAMATLRALERLTINIKHANAIVVEHAWSGPAPLHPDPEVGKLREALATLRTEVEIVASVPTPESTESNSLGWLKARACAALASTGEKDG